MEPLDPAMEYMVHPTRPSKPGARLNYLLIFPILGFLIVLTFISAAIFQFDLSNLLDPLEGVLMLLAVAVVAGLFWAMAPRAEHSDV